jgi:DNA invertase Pin-like site-specific DNA recombinase
MAVRAVGYFREGAGGKESCAPLADQNRRFLEFCRAHSYEVAATFLDGASAGGERPGFRQLLEYLRRRSEGLVVVVDQLACLGRDPREVARSYFQIAGLGATVVCMAGEGEDPTAALLAHWNARDDRTRLGERVRTAMRRKAVKGEVLGRPPYGYRAGLRHRLEVVPEEAAVVRYIFRMYTQEGLGIRLIARRLNEEGYRTRRGGNWSMVTIRDILRNRVYLGTYSRFGVRVPGSHQALIAPDDFRKAQDRMAARRTAGGPRTVSPFLLSGLLYCGACGHRMIGVTRRQTWTRRSDGGTGSAEYRYYQCGSRTNQSVCAYHTRRVEQLDEEVRLATIAALERAVTGEGAEEDRGQELESPTRLRGQLRNIDRELDRLLEQAAAGRVSRERLQAVSIELAQRRLALEEQLEVAETRSRVRQARAERLQRRQEALVQLRVCWEELAFDERQAVLRETLARVLVYDDRVEPVLRD